MMQRRRFLASAGACAIAPVGTVLSPAAQAAGMRTLGSAQAFDYAQLKGRARALASTPWQAPAATPASLAALNYDQY